MLKFTSTKYFVLKANFEHSDNQLLWCVDDDGLSLDPVRDNQGLVFLCLTACLSFWVYLVLLLFMGVF